MKLIFSHKFQKMENSCNFKLAFRGDNMSHSANAEDVGRSIMALAHLFDEVGKMQLPDELHENLILEVKGFQKGSLETLFQATMNPAALGAVVTALPFVGQIPNPKDILDFIKNTWEYFIFLKGEPAKNKKDIGDGKIQVTNQDMEAKIFVQPIVYAGDNARVQIDTKELFQALKDEKIGEVAILEDVNGDYAKTFSVNKEQAEFFEHDFIPEEDVENTEISTELVRVLNMAIDENGKWRLKAMDRIFFSRIEDEDFLRKLKNEKISNLRFLTVEMETVYSSSSNKTVRNIKKVINHFGNPEQISIESL